MSAARRMVEREMSATNSCSAADEAPGGLIVGSVVELGGFGENGEGGNAGGSNKSHSRVAVLGLSCVLAGALGLPMMGCQTSERSASDRVRRCHG